ncbi:MAG: deoxyribose-phosphate aldolase, partial [Oscillospiraceae bacterium]
LAIKYNCATFCIAPCHVAAVKKLCGNKLKICTVIGFPNGYNDTATKAFEASHMIDCGADEIDVVINLAWACAENYEAVENELKQLRRATDGKILKVIVEACRLPEHVLRKLCPIVSSVGADFIKTSTGFGEYGAREQDVRLMRELCAPKTKIKAAGGINSFEDAQKMIDAGADRIGTSRLVKLMSEY